MSRRSNEWKAMSNEKKKLVKCSDEIHYSSIPDRSIRGRIWFNTRFPLKTCGNDKQQAFSDEGVIIWQGF